MSNQTLTNVTTTISHETETDNTNTEIGILLGILFGCAFIYLINVLIDNCRKRKKCQKRYKYHLELERVEVQHNDIMSEYSEDTQISNDKNIV
jgi:predicted membrane protein